MPITEKQKAERIKNIGSSDVAALVGLDPFKTAYDVWLVKTGRVVDEEESKAMKAGQLFEAALLDYTVEQLGRITRNQTRRVEGSVILTHIDAIVNSTGQPAEGKISGLFGPLREEWGEPGTDQIPERVICQSQIHLAAVDSDLCHVPTFLGGRGFNMYEVARNEELLKVLLDAAADFWVRFVLADIQPVDSVPALRLIRKVIRVPNKVVVFQGPQMKTYLAWQAAKQIKSQAEAAEKSCKAMVLAGLGDAEGAVMGEYGALTYLESDRKGYTVKPTRVRTLRTLTKGLPGPMKNLLEGGDNNDEAKDQSKGRSESVPEPAASGTDQGEDRGTEEGVSPK